MWLFGYGASDERSVEQRYSVTGALGAARLARDAAELDEDFEILDRVSSSAEQEAVVDELRELREAVANGTEANRLILEQFQRMEERLKVLEANTFLEAAKWIFEKICELFYKMQKLVVDMCAVHDVRVEGSSPSWADIELSIS